MSMLTKGIGSNAESICLISFVAVVSSVVGFTLISKGTVYFPSQLFPILYFYPIIDTITLHHNATTIDEKDPSTKNMLPL